MSVTKNPIGKLVALAILASSGLLVACSSDSSTDDGNGASVLEIETNDTAATAQVLDLPKQVLGTTSCDGDGINPPTVVDQDIFTFTLTEQRNVIFYLSGFGLTTDLDLQLTTAGDTSFSSPLVSSAFPAGYPEGVYFSDLSPGTYLVRVYPFDTNMGVIEYSLAGYIVGDGASMSAGTGGGGGGGGGGGSCTSYIASETEGNNTYPFADYLPVPGTRTGNVNDLTDLYDWTTITPSASGNLQFTLTFTDGAADLDLWLYAPDGSTVLNSGTFGTGSNESFSWTMVGGVDYYIQVEAFSTPNGNTSYELCIE